MLFAQINHNDLPTIYKYSMEHTLSESYSNIHTNVHNHANFVILI